jgi:hypothetical protein
VLEIAVEMGVPLAVAVVTGAVASVVILGKSALRPMDWDRTSASAITGIAVLSYIHSSIELSLQIPGYLIVFGIILGCGLARAASDRNLIRRSRSLVPAPPAEVPMLSMSIGRK